MTRKLIVNADDFARSPEVSAGIIHAHLNGIVTTTTVLINLPGVERDLLRASEQAPSLGVGLHLNLTLGPPCAAASLASPLVGEDGQFHPVQHWFADPEAVPIEMLKAEWSAQVDTLLKTGLPIDHLDSHHHIAVLRDDIWDFYLELAGRVGCGVRPPLPVDLEDRQIEVSIPRHAVMYARKEALPALRRSSIPHPDNFLASFFDQGANEGHLLDMLLNVPPGISELMCHPGFHSPQLIASSRYALQRQVELEALCSPAILQQVKDSNIELVTYRQAWLDLEDR